MNKFMLSITASSGEFYQGDCEDLTLPISDGIYGVQGITRFWWRCIWASSTL